MMRMPMENRRSFDPQHLACLKRRGYAFPNLQRTPAPVAALGLRNDGAEPGRMGGPESEIRQPSAGGAVPLDG